MSVTTCAFCLSSDRSLSFVEERRLGLIYMLFEDIVDGQYVKWLQSEGRLRLCWQCQARVSSFEAFSRRVQRSVRLLMNYLDVDAEQDPPPCQSSLTITGMITVEIPPQGNPMPIDPEPGRWETLPVPFLLKSDAEELDNLPHSRQEEFMLPLPTKPQFRQELTQSLPLKPQFQQALPQPLPLRSQFHQELPQPLPLNPQFQQELSQPLPLRPQFRQVLPQPLQIRPQFQQELSQPLSLKPRTEQKKTLPSLLNPQTEQKVTYHLQLNPQLKRNENLHQTLQLIHKKPLPNQAQPHFVKAVNFPLSVQCNPTRSQEENLQLELQPQLLQGKAHSAPLSLPSATDFEEETNFPRPLPSVPELKQEETPVLQQTEPFEPQTEKLDIDSIPLRVKLQSEQNISVPLPLPSPLRPQFQLQKPLTPPSKTQFEQGKIVTVTSKPQFELEKAKPLLLPLEPHLKQKEILTLQLKSPSQPNKTPELPLKTQFKQEQFPPLPLASNSQFEQGDIIAITSKPQFQQELPQPVPLKSQFQPELPQPLPLKPQFQQELPEPLPLKPQLEQELPQPLPLKPQFAQELPQPLPQPQFQQEKSPSPPLLLKPPESKFEQGKTITPPSKPQLAQEKTITLTVKPQLEQKTPQLLHQSSKPQLLQETVEPLIPRQKDTVPLPLKAEPDEELELPLPVPLPMPLAPELAQEEGQCMQLKVEPEVPEHTERRMRCASSLLRDLVKKRSQPVTDYLRWTVRLNMCEEAARAAYAAERAAETEPRCGLCRRGGFDDEEALGMHCIEWHDEAIGDHECNICSYRFASLSTLRRHIALHFTEYTCRECAFQARSLQAMEAHCRETHNSTSVRWSKPSYQCDKCSDTFATCSSLSEHRLGCATFKCAKCELIFMKQESYAEHLRNPTCYKPVQPPAPKQCAHWTVRWVPAETAAAWYAAERPERSCPHCRTAFPDDAALAAHAAECHHESVGKYQCNICGCKFGWAPSLRKHMSAHYVQYTCRECDFQTRTLSEIEDHCFETHNATSKPVRECKKCKNAFASYAALRVHAARCCVYKCAKCEMTFERKGAYSEHVALHDEDALQKLYCKECDKQFTQEAAYRFHFRTSLRHVSRDTFQHGCPHCDMKFIGRQLLKEHVAAKHLNRGLYSCELCPKSYSVKNSLRRHSAQVHSVGNLVCEHCGKVFPSAAFLRRHMLQHLGERPLKCSTRQKKRKGLADFHKYQCEECGKEFSSNSQMRTHHKLTHLRQSNFCCEACNKVFASSTHLRNHLASRHGVLSGDTFHCECDTCGKRYHNKTDLVTHMNGHREEEMAPLVP